MAEPTSAAITVILRPLVVLLRPLTQHDRIASKRGMPHVEIQSFIKEFHVYKARKLLYFLQEYTFYSPLSFLFVSTSSVTCLLAASIREEGIRLYKGSWEIRSVDKDVFFFFF